MTNQALQLPWGPLRGFCSGESKHVALKEFEGQRHLDHGPRWRGLFLVEPVLGHMFGPFAEVACFALRTVFKERRLSAF